MKNKSIFNLKAFVFLFPTLLVFGMFLVWPLIYTVYLSFFKWNMISKNKVFVGFENYLTIFKDSSTKQILMNSFWYIFWIILFAVCLPYIMAVSYTHLTLPTN